MSWPIKIREKSREMRRKGSSFGEITSLLGISKSTLHGWVRDIEKPIQFQNRKKWLHTIRPLAINAIKRKRDKETEMILHNAQREVLSWTFLHSKEVQKALLSLLYWAEGQKLPVRGAPVKFANTDPKLVLLFVTLLKNCYGINTSKLKVLLYIHWYHNAKEVKLFWMKLLHMQDNQFYKIYRKKRSISKKFRKNFMGICFIVYHNVDLRIEIMDIAYALQDRIIHNN